MNNYRCIRQSKNSRQEDQYLKVDIKYVQNLSLQQQEDQLKRITIILKKDNFQQKLKIIEHLNMNILKYSKELCLFIQKVILTITVQSELSGMSLNILKQVINYFDICEDYVIQFISNILSDDPQFIQYFSDEIQSYLNNFNINKNSFTDFCWFAQMFARITQLMPFSPYIQQITQIIINNFTQASDMEQISNIAFFFIYTTRGNQCFYIDQQFFETMARVANLAAIESSLLKKSFEANPELAEVYFENSEELPYQELNSKMNNVESVYQLLDSNDENKIFQAIQLIQQNQIQINEDYQGKLILCLNMIKLEDINAYEEIVSALNFLPLVSVLEEF